LVGKLPSRKEKIMLLKRIIALKCFHFYLALPFTLLCLISNVAHAGSNDGLVAYQPFNGDANDEIGAAGKAILVKD
jgi:hypothetical protein